MEATDTNSHKPDLYVCDTNVFSDLINIGLLEQFFEGNWNIHTTSYIIDELEKRLVDTKQEATTNGNPITHKHFVQPYIDNGLLKIKNIGKKEQGEISGFKKTLKGKQRKASHQDCSVFLFAKEINGKILTGDKILKLIATKNAIEPRGTLFVILELANQKIITPSEGKEKAYLLDETNGWIRKELIDETVEKPDAIQKRSKGIKR